MICCLGLFAGVFIGQAMGGPWIVIAPGFGFFRVDWGHEIVPQGTSERRKEDLPWLRFLITITGF